MDGVVLPSWLELVIERKGDERRINRHAYELCVLHQQERALKCKEVWVGGSWAFRNPSQDLPTDWTNEAKRTECYQILNQPLAAAPFVTALQTRLTMALTDFNRTLPHNPYVSITVPRGEADRLAHFTRFFTHSGTKEIRSREALRPLLLLALFAAGTNIGIKRVAKANHQYSYDELLYVRKMYVSLEALRNANGAVVNTIVARRNPRLWGEGAACASDGRRFESWSQNLMTEWRSRYKGYGVLVYWHVETNAVCIYSQLRSFSSSEVAAMIEGLIRHDTEMRVEKNFVDSPGQSEVAFAFCHLLGGVRLMPRLKRLKYERLYLPDTGRSGDFPHLGGVLTRPIRWQLIAQQYDEMVKHAVALKTGTATAEAILCRFNSYNVTHPTYKALAEVGKAEKTIYLTEYLSSLALRYEVQDGLNVSEVRA
jgi:TnpA family transposase